MEPGAVHAACSIEAEEARPLSEAELARIPTVARHTSGGLSRAAKANYRARKRLARGGISFVGRPRLASEMQGELDSCSPDTVDRTNAELVDKGFLEPTGRKHGRSPEYLLRRGQGEVYELRREPQLLREEPQVAAQRSSLREKPLRSSKASLSKTVGAAASPSPADAGEAAARRTDADLDLADHHDGAELTMELRADYAERARALAERFSGASGRPAGEQAGPGTCDTCHRSVKRRWQLGTFKLCLDCLLRRHKAALRLASQVTRAETGRTLAGEAIALPAELPSSWEAEIKRTRVIG